MADHVLENDIYKKLFKNRKEATYYFVETK